MYDMKTVDFPAGHSMDTHWFAVDKDGNIAVFDSCSEGVVPIEFKWQTHWTELFNNHTVPITPALRQLYLHEKVIEHLFQKCNIKTLKQILKKNDVIGSYIVLLNENKKWEDLNFEKGLAKNEYEFAFILSPDIPLYLISVAYEIRKKFITAIKKKIIAKACEFMTYIHEEGRHVGIRDLGLYVFDHKDTDNGAELPYCKIHTPEFPLKANKIASNLADKIPHFDDKTFEIQDYIQPMEFFSCKSYVGFENIENEYAKVISSDNKEIYCRLPVARQINFQECDKCYPKKEYHFYYSPDGLMSSVAYQDYPSIIIIEDFFIQHWKKSWRYETLLKMIYNCLNISKKDCFITYCAKCYDTDKEEDKKEFKYNRLSEKFQNCYKNLNTEISVFQPLLLIAIEDTVVSLLKTKYEISGYYETPCLCNITIENKQYPLLVINHVKTKKEQAILSKYLSEKSDEINVILAQPRNLPPSKPRVIRIED